MRPVDLHTHTNRSDGSNTAREVLQLASSLGIEALALTDHDTLAGYDEAQPEAKSHGIELICGVELTTSAGPESGTGARQRSVHLLAYFVLNPPKPEFRAWLEDQRVNRHQRNLDLIANLRRASVEITLEEVEVYGRNQVGRPHFARVLRDKGYVTSLQEAFDVYLADEAKTAAARQEPLLEEAIGKVRDAGGIPTLAHPVRLSKEDGQLARFVDRLTDAGLQALEAYHSEHQPHQCAFYADLAKRFDLAVTGGSDFHGENKPEVQLGSGINQNLHLDYTMVEKLQKVCS